MYIDKQRTAHVVYMYYQVRYTTSFIQSVHQVPHRGGMSHMCLIG